VLPVQVPLAQEQVVLLVVPPVVMPDVVPWADSYQAPEE
jgi:hypothetical protein